MLPKRYRLPAKEFQLLYRKGIKAKGEYGMLLYFDNSQNIPKFGFVVSKKIGNAVRRHRMTRLLRVISMEAIKSQEFSLKSGNFEFIAFTFCDDYSKLKEDFNYLLKKLLSDEKGNTKNN